MTNDGPGLMPRVPQRARSNAQEKRPPPEPRSIPEPIRQNTKKPLPPPRPEGCVFAKSCNLPDSVFNYAQPGVITTDYITKYGDIAILGGRDTSANGVLPLKKISRAPIPPGLGSFALSGAAIASVGASCGGLCVAGPSAAVAVQTGAASTSTLAGAATGGVVAGALVGVLALLWPSSLGDASLYSESQLRNLTKARTRVRLRIEEQPDSSLKGYGYYTGLNRDWETVDVIQFKPLGAQQVADFGGGVELLWTPAVNPNDTPGIPDLEAAPNAPHIWVFPPSEDSDRIIVNPLYPPEYKDFILVFPADSGLKPLYVVLSVRDEPGVVTGQGQPVTGTWLADAGRGFGAPLPSAIVDTLRGQRFTSFDAFRKAFWIAVARNEELKQQFGSRNLASMLKGLAAAAPKAEHVGKRIAYELHHVEFIKDGGSVYDADNLRAVTPKRHINIHRGSGQ